MNVREFIFVSDCKLRLLLFGILVLFGLSAQAVAQQSPSVPDALTKNPGDLSNILVEDEAAKEALITPSPLDTILEPWDAFKASARDELGLQIGLVHTVAYQRSNTSVAGQKDAAGGILAILGTQRLWGEDAEYPGTLAFRFQDRHNIGGPINLQTFGLAAGSLWPNAVAYSEFDFTLLEMWWEQYLVKNRVGFRAGKIIPFAVHDYSFLKNPTTGFMNAAFTLNPTIAYPAVGIGASALVRPIEQIYVVGGIYDANGTPDKAGFKSFFNQKEYIKIVDIGWDPGFINAAQKVSFGPVSIRDIHATIWQKDALKQAGAPKGWGATFFMEAEIGRYLPFIRVGFSDGTNNGPALANRLVAGGLGVREMFGQKNDLLGMAFSWGKRKIGKIDTNNDYIPDTDVGNVSQYAGELFYRVQLTKRIAVTPSVQVTFNPVLQPDKDTLTFVGIRGRFEM